MPDQSPSSANQELLSNQFKELMIRLLPALSHKMANLLMAASGGIQLTLDQFSSSNINAKALDLAARAVADSSDLFETLAGYLFPEPGGPDTLNLEQFIRDHLLFLQSVLHPDIHLTFDAGPSGGGSPWIWVETEPLAQTLLTLCLNVGQTLRTRNPNPTVSVSLSWQPQLPEQDQLDFLFSDAPPAGGFVVLTVKDCCGAWNDESVKNLYHPDFSDRFENVGVGLAGVRAVMEKLAGAGRVQTQEEGLTVELYFPAHPAPQQAEEIEPAIGPLDGTETILVLDDEPLVRKALEGMLDRFDYHVIGSGDPIEAIELVSRRNEQEKKIDLVLVDEVMPHMSGSEAFKQMRKIDPTLRGLLVTATKDRFPTPQDYPDGIVDLVHKPFQISELLLTIRKTLDRRE